MEYLSAVCAAIFLIFVVIAFVVWLQYTTNRKNIPYIEQRENGYAVFMYVKYKYDGKYEEFFFEEINGHLIYKPKLFDVILYAVVMIMVGIIICLVTPETNERIAAAGILGAVYTGSILSTPIMAYIFLKRRI